MNIHEIRLAKIDGAPHDASPLLNIVHSGNNAAGIAVQQEFMLRGASELACLAGVYHGRARRGIPIAKAWSDSAKEPETLIARRYLADRLWSENLRVHYNGIQSLLDPADEPAGLDPLEKFHRRVMLADFAQCRGDYPRAAICLSEAQCLVPLQEDEASSLVARGMLCSARARNALGRRQWATAEAAIHEGLGVTYKIADVPTYVRLLSHRVRLGLLTGRLEEAAIDCAEMGKAVTTARKDRAFACFPELKAEVLFLWTTVHLMRRSPSQGLRTLERAVSIALNLESHEAVIEGEVTLVAALLMKHDPRALAQYERARSLTSLGFYTDLSGDLDRMSSTRAFLQLAKATANGTFR